MVYKIMELKKGESLALDKESFQNLPSKQQLSLLFENQCLTLKRMDDIEFLIKGYKKQQQNIQFHQRIQYGTIGILTTLGTYLLYLHIN
jgi:hypothetical protein